MNSFQQFLTGSALVLAVQAVLLPSMAGTSFADAPVGTALFGVAWFATTVASFRLGFGPSGSARPAPRALAA